MARQPIEYLPLSARLALRALRRSRYFSLATVVILGLLFGPLVLTLSAAASLFVEPHRTMAFNQLYTIGDAHRNAVSFPDFQSIQALAESRDARFLAYRVGDAEIVTPRGPSSKHVGYASDGFFAAAGARLARGRDLNAKLDGGSICVLSARAWRKDFGADPAILGKVIRVDSSQVTVIGVARAGFLGIHTGDEVDVWMPIAHLRSDSSSEWAAELGYRDARVFRAAVRLTGGLRSPALSARLHDLAGALAVEYPGTDAGVSFVVRPLAKSPLEASARQSFDLLALAAYAVLLAVLASLAALGLARATANERELALLSILGAQPRQLLAPIVLETAFLSCGGAVVSVVLTLAGLTYWRSHAEMLPDFLWPHWYVVLVAVVSATLLGAVAGAAFLRRATGNLAADASRRFGRRANRTVLGVVAIAQVALAVAVFGVALTALDGVRTARETNPGFDPDGVIATRLSVKWVAWDAQLQQLMTEIRGLPGVASAAITNDPVLDGSRLFTPSSYATGDDGAALPGHPEVVWIGPQFFRTLRLPLLQGREFNTSDFKPAGVNVASPRTVIISRSLARALWPRGGALGKTLRFRGRSSVAVVGIVGDAAYGDIRTPPRPRVYYPVMNYPDGAYQLLLRLERSDVSNPRAVAALIARSRFATADPVVFHSLDATRDAALGPIVRRAEVVLGVAGLAWLIAAIGLFGSLAFHLERRRKEIAVRLALGAPPLRAVARVIGGLAVFAGFGTLLGNAVAAGFLTQLPGFTFYSTGAFDGRVAIVTVISTGVVLLLAAAGPFYDVLSVSITKTLNAE